MMDIGLAALANQALSVQLDERFYEIALRDAAGVVAVSITRDGVPLVSNLRATSGTPLLPYQYQEAGNFVIVTDDDALPDWREFGVTQFLVYVSDAELAAYRSA